MKSVLEAYDIVEIKSEVAEVEIRGRRGHIVGAVDADQIGVFVHGLERVWCLHPNDVAPTGERLPDDQQPDPAVIVRVSQKGEVIG